jgi:magnesium transporter
MSGMIATLERLLSDITSNLGILESAMNFSLTVATHRTNLVMNRLAVVSTIFLPLTFLCGVYGMNFEGIPELAWTHGYKFFWALSALITVGLVLVLRRARLL